MTTLKRPAAAGWPRQVPVTPPTPPTRQGRGGNGGESWTRNINTSLYTCLPGPSPMNNDDDELTTSPSHFFVLFYIWIRCTTIVVQQLETPTSFTVVAGVFLLLVLFLGIFPSCYYLILSNLVVGEENNIEPRNNTAERGRRGEQMTRMRNEAVINRSSVAKEVKEKWRQYKWGEVRSDGQI